MKIITALANENINERLRKETNCEVIHKDIQYQEALLEILDKNKKIDALILSSILPGELDIYELINIIKYKKENIKIFIILEKQNDKLINFLIKKGINNIFINNKITEEDLMEKIFNKNPKTEEKTEKKEIIKINKKNKYFNKIKIFINKKINKNKYKKYKNKKIVKKSKIIFSILLSFKLKNKKIFFIEINIKKLNPKKIKKIGGKKKMKNVDLENINYEKNITLENTLINVVENVLDNIKEKQSQFINSNFAKAVNTGIDVGLRVVLPDVIEDEIINIKNSFINDGFKAGIETAIDESINLGKSAIGIVTGTFENISQIKKAVEKGGLIDSISDVLDNGIKWLKDKEIINKNIYNAIKKGKNTILNTIEDNIGSSLENQIEALEKIDGYIEKWQKYYEEKDFSNMEYQYKKIEEYLEKVLPLESTLTKAKQLQNIHELIKNNGKKFDLTEEEKELANMLIN